jgi:hypothetical protein
VFRGLGFTLKCRSAMGGDHGSERKDSVAKQNPVSVLNGGDCPHKDLARFFQCTQMPHSRVEKFVPFLHGLYDFHKAHPHSPWVLQKP